MDKIHNLTNKSTAKAKWTDKKKPEPVMAGHPVTSKKAEKVIPLEDGEMKDF